MKFSKLNITNSVIYYTLDTIINIFEIFDLLEIDTFVIGMKIRNLSKGEISGSAFKNALHIRLKEDRFRTALDIKFFSNGKIQIPGSVNHSDLLEVLEKLFIILKNLKNEKFYNLNYCNFYFNKSYIVGKYNGIVCNRIKVLENNNGVQLYILIPEEIRLLKQDNYFYSDDHFRKRKVYNNIGEYLGMSQVVMKERKNLPKNGSFYIKNKKLFYNYNSKMFGEIIEPEIKNKTLDENEKLKTIIFYNENFKIDLNISNTNGSFKIISDLEIDKTKLFDLLSLKYTTIYNPNDYPAIKCVFYYNNLSNSFTKKETSSSNTIKVQIYGDRVNLTGRTKKIVVAGYSFLTNLLLELNEQGFYKSVFKPKDIDISFKECTIFDLYELI